MNDKASSKEVVSKNDNVLAGLRCPKCMALEPFEIQASCVAEVWDDGIESSRDFEWDQDDNCSCLSCGFAGIVKDFTEKAKPSE
jgi:hypothetical protein